MFKKIFNLVVNKFCVVRDFFLKIYLKDNRLVPLSSTFGYGIGTPIDRYYIDAFLEKNKSYINGNLLEIGDDEYIKKYGGAGSNLLVLTFSKDKKNKKYFFGDLTDLKTLKKGKFDCFVCTQTLNFIYDFDSAVKGAHYLLKKNGVVLVTVSGISQISRYDYERWGDYWRFTPLSAKKLFSKYFGESNVIVDYYGNVDSAKCFLDGVPKEALSSKQLDYKDPDYPMLITIVAVKK